MSRIPAPPFFALPSLLFSVLLALSACGGDGGSGDTTDPPPPGGLEYTGLAQPLLDHLAVDRAGQVPSSAALATNIVLAADFYDAQPRILTANYGFDGYMGVPGLNGTDAVARAAALDNDVAWQAVDPGLDAPSRALDSAVGVAGFRAVYGVDALRADTIPVVFSHPVLPASVSPGAFRVRLDDGTEVVPITASLLPNLEYNERQTVVLSGYWGNRIAPGQPGAQYPVRVDVVPAPTPMMLVTAQGLAPAAGLGIDSRNPYVPGNGPRMVAAKLNLYSSLGEGGPQSQPNSFANSGEDLYGAEAQYRLRIYTSAGFSPDGIASILPTEYGRFFLLRARDQAGRVVDLAEAGRTYAIAGYGAVRVLGLADTGSRQDAYDAAYVEDHDNQYDVILAGDLAAVRRIHEVRLPSSGAYSAVYNPGGPGNQPEANPPGAAFTVPSQDHGVAVTDDIAAPALVSYVEVDGPVPRDAAGQPRGRLLGAAVIDHRSGHRIQAYADLQGRRFFASFPVQP